MELWIAVFFLCLTFVVNREGFDTSDPDKKPEGYPDQSMYADLIAAEKYIEHELKSSTLEENKKRMLKDLLNLLQFI